MEYCRNTPYIIVHIVVHLNFLRIFVYFIILRVDSIFARIAIPAQTKSAK